LSDENTSESSTLIAQKYLQWAQKKLEKEYSGKISELQKMLYQEFSDAEQFQAQVEDERKKMKEKMESIL
jgi:hypothetical protein